MSNTVGEPTTPPYTPTGSYLHDVPPAGYVPHVEVPVEETETVIPDLTAFPSVLTPTGVVPPIVETPLENEKRTIIDVDLGGSPVYADDETLVGDPLLGDPLDEPGLLEYEEVEPQKAERTNAMFIGGGLLTLLLIIIILVLIF